MNTNTEFGFDLTDEKFNELYRIEITDEEMNRINEDFRLIDEYYAENPDKLEQDILLSYEINKEAIEAIKNGTY